LVAIGPSSVARTTGWFLSSLKVGEVVKLLGAGRLMDRLGGRRADRQLDGNCTTAGRQLDGTWTAAGLQLDGNWTAAGRQLDGRKTGRVREGRQAG
jgi:hypothetical protein